MVKLFSGRCRIAGPSVPVDANIVSVHHDYACNGWVVLIHSYEFEPVPENAQIPGLSPREILTLESFPDNPKTSPFSETDRKLITGERPRDDDVLDRD